MKKVTLLLTGLLFVSCFMNTSKATDVKIAFDSEHSHNSNWWANNYCPNACLKKGLTYNDNWHVTGPYFSQHMFCDCKK